MRSILLCFEKESELDSLLKDLNFKNEISHLNPIILTSTKILLFDPVESHNLLDTEVVILAKFARAIKRILFPSSTVEVEFISKGILERKQGLSHNGIAIISSTDLEITTFAHHTDR